MICIAMSLCADVFVHSQPLLSLKHKQKHIMKWQSGCAAMQTHHPPMKEDRKYHLLSDLKEISGENSAKTFHMITVLFSLRTPFFQEKECL